jgi:hypothetical protein
LGRWGKDGWHVEKTLDLSSTPSAVFFIEESMNKGRPGDELDSQNQATDVAFISARTPAVYISTHPVQLVFLAGLYKRRKNSNDFTDALVDWNWMKKVFRNIQEAVQILYILPSILSFNSNMCITSWLPNTPPAMKEVLSE